MCNYLDLYLHESAHAQVCKGFDGVVTEKQVSLHKSYTKCMIPETPEYNLAQANVEAFGYQLTGLLNTIILLFIVFGLYVIKDD